MKKCQHFFNHLVKIFHFPKANQLVKEGTAFHWAAVCCKLSPPSRWRPLRHMHLMLYVVCVTCNMIFFSHYLEKIFSTRIFRCRHFILLISIFFCFFFFLIFNFCHWSANWGVTKVTVRWVRVCSHKSACTSIFFQIPIHTRINIKY